MLTESMPDVCRRSWIESTRTSWPKWRRWASSRRHSLCWLTTTRWSRSPRATAHLSVTGTTHISPSRNPQLFACPCDTWVNINLCYYLANHKLVQIMSTWSSYKKEFFCSIVWIIVWHWFWYCLHRPNFSKVQIWVRCRLIANAAVWMAFKIFVGVVVFVRSVLCPSLHPFVFLLLLFFSFFPFFLLPFAPPPQSGVQTGAFTPGRKHAAAAFWWSSTLSCHTALHEHLPVLPCGPRLRPDRDLWSWHHHWE